MSTFMQERHMLEVLSAHVEPSTSKGDPQKILSQLGYTGYLNLTVATKPRPNQPSPPSEWLKHWNIRFPVIGLWVLIVRYQRNFTLGDLQSNFLSLSLSQYLTPKRGTR
jgi:hypothetical protein